MEQVRQILGLVVIFGCLYWGWQGCPICRWKFGHDDDCPERFWE